jgi:hypothetical protein
MQIEDGLEAHALNPKPQVENGLESHATPNPKISIRENGGMHEPKDVSWEAAGKFIPISAKHTFTRG